MLKFFRLPFATTGDKTAVPDAVDSNGNVSYSQGYGFDYQRQKTDPAAKNIERDKMNQILFDITTAIAEIQSQGAPDYITSALNGGTAYSYAQYAIVKYSGALYISLVAANTALPSDATKWALLPTPALLQQAAYMSANGAGTVDAITAAFTPAIAALPAAPGTLSVFVRAAGANLTTTPTFKADALAAKTIVKGNNVPLVAGDIAGAGHWLELHYDATLDKWVLQNPAFGIAGVTSANLQSQTFTAFTTGGVSGTFTLTPSPALTSYAAGQRFRAKFSAAGNGSDTINVSALGAKSLKQYDSAGNKIAPVIASGCLFDVEYDGVDFVILDPLPPNIGAPSSVRQTVLGGPVDSSGYPSFLPATSASLSVTSQNVSSSAKLVVSSANGFAAGGVFDRLGSSSSNLTWAALTANTTNYLYVDVAANGTLTPGSTTLAPAYQQGGTRSTTNGQATFNIGEMYMTVGNGSSAAQAFRVFVGEAVTNAGTVTGTTAYAYQGKYDSGFYALAANTLYNKRHNIGSFPTKASQIVSQNSDGSGWCVFAGVYGDSTGTNQGTSIVTLDSNAVSLRTGINYVCIFTDSTGAQLTATSGYGRQILERGW